MVTALDLTHDPAGGCDIHAIARRLALEPHPELEYVISNREVAKRRNGFRWEPYYGDNGHTLHAHFAVGTGPDSDPMPPYDSTLSWGVSLTLEDDMTPEQAAKLDAIELRLIELDDDIPENLGDILAELRRNIRTVAAKVGVPADQIET